MKHAISWFEIPAADIERAQKFYEAVFDIKMVVMDGLANSDENAPNIRMRMFPIEDLMNGIGGAIVDSGGFHKASLTEGPLIYLNANPDLQIFLDRVETAGGKVLVPKTQISPEHGFMAVIMDSEGNRIGMHSVSL